MNTPNLPGAPPGARAAVPRFRRREAGAKTTDQVAFTASMVFPRRRPGPRPDR